MRVPHWLNLLSAAFFVFGIVFVVAAERAAKDRPAPTPAAPAAPTVPAVASVRQLMTGIIDPGAQVVWESVATTVSRAGVEEKRPRTDEEWAAVASGAAAAAEGANLLLTGGRAVDQEAWAQYSKELVAASEGTMKAVEARDPEQILLWGEKMYSACTSCHRQYLRN